MSSILITVASTPRWQDAGRSVSLPDDVAVEFLDTHCTYHKYGVRDEDGDLIDTNDNGMTVEGSPVWQVLKAHKYI